MPTHLLGIDIGTSSVKAAVLRAEDGALLGDGTSPDTELPIHSPHPGWAEQDPETWWTHTIAAVQRALTEAKIAPGSVAGIGIAYQMHGLVTLDERLQPVRPAIIWCDGRAVAVGRSATKHIGESKCLEHLLNPLGNFTVSKLLWLRENEPDAFRRIRRVMLPGDYVGLRMTGESMTTITGLSEAMAWDFRAAALAPMLEDVLELSPSLFPPAQPSFAVHGTLNRGAAESLGLAVGIPVSYKAGDQPNNALALGVLEPGVTAASAGTSGVLYTVAPTLVSDGEGRVNTFMHVNGTATHPVCATLLCINGVGSANRWLRDTFFPGGTYSIVNRAAEETNIGAEGISFLSFGNGSERVLQGASPGAGLCGVDFNRHTRSHIARAVQEGVAFAFRFGVEHLSKLGARPTEVRAPYSSMFLNPLFCEALSTICRVPLHLISTDGAQGAARGAGIGAGVFSKPSAAFVGLHEKGTSEPMKAGESAYEDAYLRWSKYLTCVMREEP